MSKILVHVMDENKTVLRDENQKLRPNFTAEELACPHCNTLVMVKEQMDLIQACREYTGSVTVSSHYRCRGFNISLKNASDESKHQHGKATDLLLNPDGRTKEWLIKFIQIAVKNGAREIGIYHNGQNFIHVGCEALGFKNDSYDGIDFNLYVMGNDKHGLLKEFVKKKVVEPNYLRIGSTHIVELNPLDLKMEVVSKRGIDIVSKNHVNCSFVWWEDSKHTRPYPTSLLAFDGKLLNNFQPNGYSYQGKGLQYFEGKGVPTPVLIVYKDGSVKLKDTNDLSSEIKDIHIAVTGVECFPKVREQGFSPYVNFSTVGYATNRIGIAYRKKDNKILLVYRPSTDINRFKETMDNLGVDFAISLDSGGSANFIVNGMKINATTRYMYVGLTW